jgi:hypothetical protein
MSAAVAGTKRNSTAARAGSGLGLVSFTPSALLPVERIYHFETEVSVNSKHEISTPKHSALKD